MKMALVLRYFPVLVDTAKFGNMHITRHRNRQEKYNRLQVTKQIFLTVSVKGYRAATLH